MRNVINTHMRSFQQFLLEYDRDKTVASLGSKFKARMAADRDLNNLNIPIQFRTPKTVIEHLEKGDPTPNKQYVQWLVKAYTNGSRIEDLISRGRAALTKLEQLKKKKLLKAVDVGQLADLKALEDLVDSVELPEEEIKDKGKSEELLNNDEVRVIAVYDEAAALYYGQGTKWCTAAKENNQYQHYARRGDLVILIPKHPKRVREKYQIHFQDDQWMDEKDRAFDPDLMAARFPSLDLSEIAFKVGHRLIPKAFQEGNDMKRISDALLKRLKEGTIDMSRIVHHAVINLKGRWPEAEPYIVKDPEHAYQYAQHVIKGRWKEAEPLIVKDPWWAGSYAIWVVKNRWPELEKFLLESGTASAMRSYIAALVHKLHLKAWPEGLKFLLQKDTPENLAAFAINVINGRWLEAEPIIMKEPRASYTYARGVIKGRWKEAEPIIMKDARWAFEYAHNVIKGPWPEAEPYIAKEPEWNDSYQSLVKEH